MKIVVKTNIKVMLTLVALLVCTQFANATKQVDPSTPPTTPPVLPVGKVVSVFSDAYTQIPGFTNFSPSWQQSTQQSIIQVGTNNILKYVNFNYQGIELGSDINAQDMKYLHVDLYSDDQTSVNIFCISRISGEKKKTLALTLGQWNEFNIPISDFTSQGLQAHDIYQFKLDGGNSSGKTFYLANLYFWTDAANDTQAPTALTASKGIVTGDGVYLNLNATDNSVVVFFEITYNAIVVKTSSSSAVTKQIKIENLTAGTDYSFSIVAKDRSGNTLTNPVVVTATTLAPMPAAPVPTIEASKVISVYSDSYTNIMGPNYWEDWYKNKFSTVMLGGNNTTLKNSAECCFGTSFTTPTIDITGMTKLHLDVYPETNTAMKFGMYVNDFGDVNKALTLITGQWNQIDLSLAELKTLFPAADFRKVKQISFQNVLGTFYLDNLYFYNDAFNSVSNPSVSDIQVFPNPMNDRLQIKSNSNIKTIEIRNLMGQLVKTSTLNSVEQVIEIADLPPANYVVVITLANGQLSNHKVIKL